MAVSKKTKARLDRVVARQINRQLSRARERDGARYRREGGVVPLDAVFCPTPFASDHWDDEFRAYNRENDDGKFGMSSEAGWGPEGIFRVDTERRAEVDGWAREHRRGA
jgi:hypothetical protein